MLNIVSWLAVSVGGNSLVVGVALIKIATDLGRLTDVPLLEI